MNLDGGTIGIVGLILAALGIVATILAPRFVGGARVSFSILNTAPLRHREQIGTLRISVFQDAHEVVGNIYLVTAEMVNCGSKDISLQEFVDPVKFTPAAGIEILSMDADDADSVGIVTSVIDHEGYLEWRLLKRGEKVALRFVVKSARPLERNRKKPIHPEIRLKDVTAGTGIVSRLRLRAYLMAAVVLFIMTISVGFIPVNEHFPVFREGDSTYRIRINGNNFSKCLIESRVFYLNSCTDISKAEAEALLKSSSLDDVNAGVRPLFFYGVLVFSLVYAAIFTYASRIVGSAFRYFNRQELW